VVFSFTVVHISCDVFRFHQVWEDVRGVAMPVSVAFRQWVAICLLLSTRVSWLVWSYQGLEVARLAWQRGDKAGLAKVLAVWGPLDWLTAEGADYQSNESAMLA
jgi:hypothetical protein